MTGAIRRIVPVVFYRMGRQLAYPHRSSFDGIMALYLQT